MEAARLVFQDFPAKEEDDPVVIDGDLSSPCRFAESRGSAVRPGGAEENSLLLNFANFKRSGILSRVMFYDGIRWADFPSEVVGRLRSVFAEGRTTVEVVTEGNRNIVDFLRMSQTDLVTGLERSISWIDAAGKCYFPKRFVGGRKGLGTIADIEIEDVEVESGASRRDGRTWSGAAAVGLEDRCGRMITTLMCKIDPNATVTSIHRCTHSGPAAEARRKAFQLMVQSTQAVRGNANLKWGFFGASPERLATILNHGFGQHTNDLLGPEAYGAGLSLAPAECLELHGMSMLPDSDGDGLRHVMLCQAIMGNPEKVENCSTRFHPSGSDFDSGVDDLQSPSRFVIWSTHINTHILPVCIVSFRTADHPFPQETRMRKAAPAKRTNPRRALAFSQLLAELGRSFPPSTMKILGALFDRYKAGRIQKEVLIRYLLSVAGSKFLRETIRKIQNCW